MPLIIVDFNRTLYDPVRDDIIEGAREMLLALSKKGARLVLVSKKEPEGESGRRDALKRMNIAHLFDNIMFVDEKNEELFSGLIRTYGIPIQQTYVIGDYLYDEIRAGNRCGAITIRYKQGKFAALVPKCLDDEPTATVERLTDIPELVR